MHYKHRPVGVSAPRFSFVVVADTHVNESDDSSSSPFDTNRLANDRARFVFREIAKMEPTPRFVIHLGDIVHPMPALPTFAQAVRQFKSLTAELPCPLYVLPGNHDVGDKRIDWMPADQVSEEHLASYRAAFGDDFLSFDAEGIRCVLINSLLINSGLPAEAEQKEWLEKQIASADGKRVFLFMHYPPFVYSENEPGSYDNLDEPGRQWLVSLMKDPRVEASFAGHVHNFWYDRLADSDFYMLPSTAFLRHDYSEFYRVKPEIEFGRGDNAKFGYFIVDVHDDGHVAYPVRTMGRQTRATDHEPGTSVQFLTHPRTSRLDRVGVELRHDWAEISHIPATGGVQEFGRKIARNDYPLLALWEMGARLSKVTDQDALDPRTRRRMQMLARMGHRFVLTTLGVPGRQLQALDLADAGVVAVEANLSLSKFEANVGRLVEFMEGTKLQVYWSKIHTYDDTHYDGRHFSHFVKSGFVIADLENHEALIEGALAGKVVSGITVRIESGSELLASASSLQAFSDRHRCGLLASIKLSGPSIARENRDEAALLESVCLAILLSRQGEGVKYIFDTFMDVDRGYYPRGGFIDRQFNPKAAARAFATLNSIFSNSKVEIDRGLSKTGSHLTFSADGVLHRIIFGGYDGSLEHAATTFRVLDLAADSDSIAAGAGAMTPSSALLFRFT